MKKLRLKVDSRDKHAYMRFGQIAKSDLDRSMNFDDPTIPEKDQPFGDIKCVLYTATYLGQNRTKKEYDINELWERVPHYIGGTDLREVFGEVIKNGLKVKGSPIYEKPFSSYWRADTGSLDAFDNARSACIIAQSPLAIGSYWFKEWANLKAGDVMPVGKTPVSGHMYAAQGWNLASINGVASMNGEPMLIIEFWGQHTLLMPRATFNETMKSWGAGSWILSTFEIDEKRRKTLEEKLIDLMKNLIIMLRGLIRSQSAEPVAIAPAPPAPSKFLWGTPGEARKSVRMICDEEGLSLDEKNLITAVIAGESGFKTKVERQNTDKRRSTDYGICQYNSYWYIERGKMITKDQALNDPEFCVRLMIKRYRQGFLKDWVAYSSGSYKQYL